MSGGQILCSATIALSDTAEPWHAVLQILRHVLAILQCVLLPNLEMAACRAIFAHGRGTAAD